jgi:hypothetical protein
VDRRLLAGIEGEIRIVDVVRDEPGALARVRPAWRIRWPEIAR